MLDCPDAKNAAKSLKIGLLVLLCAMALAAQTGCARQQYLSVREQPYSPLVGPLKLISSRGPRPSPRTQQLLRRYDLAEKQESKPAEVLAKLQDELATDPSPDKFYSYAELSFIEAKKLEESGKVQDAFDLYGSSVANSYQYLFDPELDRFRNPYDPLFRRACDLYNGALESAMRIVAKQGKLKPGQIQTIETGRQRYDLQIEVRGSWHAEDLHKLEFVNDYQLEDGLTNHHQTFGLGVPLIAVRAPHENESSAEKYYPPNISFPVTAFLRVIPETRPGMTGKRCILELYDPMLASNIEVSHRLVPLETDLSTPLAFFLQNPAFKETDIATFGLLNPDKAQGIKGLYMVEPYDPLRIPVVMVHGLWSSPTTWMEMFNDLRAYPEIRSRYQFWFYLYPTGQPFWISAGQMRETLAEVRSTLDPSIQNPRLDQMVLVGHSMGGLVSKMQTIESGDAFWNLLSDRPLSELQATPEDREKIERMMYFHPNPSIKRVITMGTPHRGSEFASDYVRLLGRKLIVLPKMMVELNTKVIRENPDYFKNTEMLTTTTSIDSLAPNCPIFDVLLNAQQGPWMKYHNVVGVLPREGFVGKWSDEGDGIVAYQSAHLENVASELTVNADHMKVHSHPLSILEVRRILLEHYFEVQGLVGAPRPISPNGYCPGGGLAADVSVGSFGAARQPPMPMTAVNGVPLQGPPWMPQQRVQGYVGDYPAAPAGTVYPVVPAGYYSNPASAAPPANMATEADARLMR